MRSFVPPYYRDYATTACIWICSWFFCKLQQLLPNKSAWLCISYFTFFTFYENICHTLVFLLPSFRNLPYSKLSDQIFHQRLFAKVWSDSLTFGFRKLDSPLQERQQTEGMFFFQAIILSVRRQIFGLGAAWLFIAPVKKKPKKQWQLRTWLINSRTFIWILHQM